MIRMNKNNYGTISTEAVLSRFQISTIREFCNSLEKQKTSVV